MHILIGAIAGMLFIMSLLGLGSALACLINWLEDKYGEGLAFFIVFGGLGATLGGAFVWFEGI